MDGLLGRKRALKKCPRCGKLLEDSEFYVQKSGRHKGKLTSWCKKYCSKQSAERYKNNIEKCREEHRNWVNKNKDKVAFTKAKSAYGITKEEYDQWRYKYPELDTSNHWKKVVSSQGLSDVLIEN